MLHIREGGVVEQVLGGAEDVTYTTSVNGQNTLVTLLPLRESPGSPDIAGVIQLNSPLVLASDVLNRELVLLLVGLVLALLVGALGSLWVTTSALAPLRRMIVTSRRIAAGNIGERVNLPQRQDEVGQFAAAFDDMVACIETTITAQRRFIADAAHQLRTPLTAVSGSLELLLRGGQDDPATTDRLIQATHREVIRLRRIAEQLLDLSKLEMFDTVQASKIELDAFMVDFADQARVLARDRQFLLQQGAPAAITADPDRLQQALLNLVDNAVRHTPSGAAIRVGWQTRPEFIDIWAADNGYGIPAEDQAHIFEPFNRGQQSRSRQTDSSGLGLAIVKNIVVAHGGQIRVESSPGRGSRFTITLAAAA